MKPAIVLERRKDPPLKNKSFVRSRSRSGNVRGQAVSCLRKAKVIAESEDGLRQLTESKGARVATCLMTIRLERDDWRMFKHQCKLLGLTWKVPTKPPDKADRYYEYNRRGERVDVIDPVDTSNPALFGAKVEVSGEVRLLQMLRQFAFCIGYEYCLDVGSPRFNSHGGPRTY